MVVLHGHRVHVDELGQRVYGRGYPHADNDQLEVVQCEKSLGTFNKNYFEQHLVEGERSKSCRICFAGTRDDDFIRTSK